VRRLPLGHPPRISLKEVKRKAAARLDCIGSPTAGSKSGRIDTVLDVV
jgi:hypothetical protein